MNKIIVKQSQRGYTLIEMAVVLVIFGAAIGALFQGKEMIENAKIKSVISDFENITQAYYFYIKRTGREPGLLLESDGNIDREGIWDTTSFIRDLVAENLLIIKEGNTAGVNAYGGNWTVRSRGGIYNSFAAAQLCSGALPLFVAEAIDQKLDDGNPATGRVMTRYNSTYLTTYDSPGGIYTFGNGQYKPNFVACRRL